MGGKTGKIFLAGHNGMVGSAFMRFFHSNKNVTLITRRRSDLDLRDQKKFTISLDKKNPITLSTLLDALVVLVQIVISQRILFSTI